MKINLATTYKIIYFITIGLYVAFIPNSNDWLFGFNLINSHLLFHKELENDYKELFRKIFFIALLMAIVFFRYFSLTMLILFIPHFIMLYSNIYRIKQSKTSIES